MQKKFLTNEKSITFYSKEKKHNNLEKIKTFYQTLPLEI